MLTHLTYMIFFFSKGVVFMGVFNIFSVTFYTGGIVYLAKNGNSVRFLQITLIEIITHAIFATLFAGWDYGFQMFLISMIPAPYMILRETKALTHIISGFIITLFVVLRISCVDLDFCFDRSMQMHTRSDWYILNSILSFLIILQVTIWFKIKMRELNRSLSERNEQLMQAASVDSLTGLLNRRAMGGFLTQIESECTCYSAALMDIDFFKNVNDTYGHAAGDEVLVEISKILLESVPAEAYICRWGGEEILLIFPGIGIESTKTLIENVRKKISDVPFESGDKTFHVTATFGISEYSGQSAEEIIKLADDRLYCGKHNGRNCVVCS